jgi:hypothetical protein
MPYIEIPNKKKVQKKFEYHKDANSPSLPSDVLKTLRDNAFKYSKKKGGTTR